MLLCKIEIPFTVGIRVEADINITTESQNGLFGIVWCKRRFPLFESFDVQFCKLVTDSHHLLKISGSLFTHQRDQLSGLVQKGGLAEFSGDRRSIKVQRFCRGNDRQHGYEQRSKVGNQNTGNG